MRKHFIPHDACDGGNTERNKETLSVIFTSALWMVYMTQEPESMPSYRSFPITLFSQFELSVGLIDLPVDHTIATPPIVHVLHCTFSVVSYILLLNLLIAMMSDTHWRVAQERDELWRTQVLRRHA